MPHPASLTSFRYDHYLLLNHLSSEPNFRWCLRDTCDSGQLYEATEHLEPHVYCDECAFEMCFTHQIPWHEGLSCEQYDSQREHGDPDYQQTQGWLRSNAKNCPGPNCGVSIEKDAGCFHMTCEDRLLPLVYDWNAMLTPFLLRSILSSRVLLAMSC